MQHILMKSALPLLNRAFGLAEGGILVIDDIDEVAAAFNLAICSSSDWW
jgi:hypothetical protein